jgi:hypothetical protein
MNAMNAMNAVIADIAVNERQQKDAGVLSGEIVKAVLLPQETP